MIYYFACLFLLDELQNFSVKLSFLVCFLCPVGRVAGSVAQVPAQYSPPRPDHRCCPISGSRGWHDGSSAARHEASHTWYTPPASSSDKNFTFYAFCRYILSKASL